MHSIRRCLHLGQNRAAIQYPSKFRPLLSHNTPPLLLGQRRHGQGLTISLTAMNEAKANLSRQKEATMTNRAYASETLAETIHALRDTSHAPMFTMKRQANFVVALVIAISVLAASALPSHADKRGDNIAKFLAGALVIGLIANSIDNNKHHAAPTPKPQPIGLPRVPSVCAISIDSNSGDAVTMFPEKCLRREGFNYRLPDCARSVRIYGESDRIYSAKCLREAGFKVGR